ncbi:MAG: UPF0175 family protein [Cyanobacteriota bacterium]|nr:UPF0175 family protein [Cyanobacteriota bacterium]
MEITVNIPEEIGDRLEQNWGNLPQKILEVLAVEGYQNGVLTVYQVQQLLNFDSRWQTEEFLSERQAYIDYTLADLDNDLNTLNRLLSK